MSGNLGVPIVVENVFMVPGLGFNLLSATPFDALGYRQTLKDGTRVIGPPSNPALLRAQLVANSWVLEVTRPPTPALPAVIAPTVSTGRRSAIAVWHRRLGDIAMGAIRRVVGKRDLFGILHHSSPRPVF
ncbi:hypothetical protein L202_02564 [Cryptococcus amylolentus CBS 6039]|uniref:Uncharacterized protein n=2 Tax=Cryptococcus amylolentus TaxID=104669 RepID=A0A1E3I110_9TREE|nr:hypothetical protein L202_02564 [Cryptococcus amylolentus CBS 6039]ODN82283.1 hypothetical protein L202_02564 [Cryptococcus amylolentus CBS 6039]ODO09644.1 hypothetical protein I350_01856 [Cryptococcus amylolentus CBS 6273]